VIKPAMGKVLSEESQKSQEKELRGIVDSRKKKPSK
jgi:hypothetical protein